MLKKITVSMLLLFLGFSSPTIHAKEINDSVALNGIETAKSVFLIDFTNPKKNRLLSRYYSWHA